MAYPKKWVEETRAKILADPYHLAGILGIDVEWFHRTMLDFCTQHPRHLLEAARGTGKSTVCTTLYIIHQLLCNHDIRILIISRTEGQASRMLQEVRGHLEHNKTLQACFGKFVGLGKWTDTALTIAQRKAVHKEASVSAMGLEGQITSGHWEVIIFDDPFDEESSRTPMMRDRAYEWLFTTLTPTLMPGGTMGGRCTRYHYDDLAGRIERELATDTTTGECFIYRVEAVKQEIYIQRSAAWKVMQIPIILRDGKSLWESKFPIHDRVDADGKIIEGMTRKRASGGTGAARRFGQQYMMICEPEVRGELESEFRRAWFRPWKRAPERAKLEVYMRVDPAFRDREQAAQRTKRDRDPDYFAIGVVGFDRAAGRAYVLDAFRDRLTPLEREKRAKEMADKWKPSLVEVERTGLQIGMAPEFYRTILASLRPHRAKFYAPGPQGSKVARAQPFARALEEGRVEWDPTIFDRYPLLVDEFVEFPWGLHDDFVDAICGAFLMGDKRPVDRARFARQGSVAPAADSRFSRPGAAAGITNRYTLPAGAVGGKSKYSR